MREDPSLRELLDDAFDADDAARVHERVRRTLAAERGRVPAPRRAARAPLALSLGAAALVLGLAFYLVRPPEPSPRRTVAAAPAAAGPLLVAGTGERFVAAADPVTTLADGSRLERRGATSLEAIENTAERLFLAQGVGEITYDVTPGGPRRWTIDAGLATVDVVGTRFTVRRRPDVVEVQVDRGRVRVRGPYLPDVVSLGPGESTRVSPPLPETTDLAEVTDVAELAEATDAPRRPRARWRVLVERGEYAGAYAEIRQRGYERELTEAVDPPALWALADATRLSGHAEQAVEPLSRLMARTEPEARASIAAFTLGRIELESLDRPRDAARSFERAIALGVPHHLLESAHNRRVEAYQRTGDADATRRAASAYLDAYPEGRWAPRWRRVVEASAP